MADKNQLVEIISEQSIVTRVKELGEQITKDYENKDLVIVSILKGGIIFTADLVRHVALPLDITCMSVSSYGSDTVSSGRLDIKLNVDRPVKGRDILIVDDIIDTGNTLFYLKNYFKEMGAGSVKVCAFLDKPSRRIKDIKADYVGFAIEDYFSVGYGMDKDSMYRNLKNICRLSL